MVYPNKIDSNFTGLAIAEEASLKTLPGTPVWQAMEPNSYSDLGSDISSVSRDPINPSRQKRRGTVTDEQAAGGFNTDYTYNNLTKLMQGFCFANLREHVSTAPVNGTQVTLTGVTSTTYTASTGLASFAANDLVFASGFAVAQNNGLKLLSASASGSITTTGLATETPPATAKVEAVGFQFTSGDATITVASGVATLGSTSKDLTTLGLNVGEFMFVGGDTTATKFATCPVFYGRVKSIATNAIVFDKVTGAAVSDTGTGKTVQIFFGKFLRNEDATANIIRRTYQVERQLGNDGDGIQSEILVGAVANEFTLNIPAKDKLNADLNFLALSTENRTGTQGLKAGTRVAALGETAINTTSDVYRLRLNIIDAATLQPTPLFAYVTEGNISIKNNASVNDAIGVLGGFDVTVGNFEVGGSLTAYFSTVTAKAAIKNNSDITFDAILAKGNKGIVYDIPMLGLGGGKLDVSKDAAIKIPLEMMAAQGSANYTLGITSFMYLPNAAMPTAQ